MTTHLPLVSSGLEGGSDSVRKYSRLLIVFPLADLYSGVG